MDAFPPAVAQRES